jgi:SAM-dependent methyltransferase
MWDQRYTDTPQMWSTTPNVWVKRELSGLPPGLALDRAAGEGRNAVWLAEQGWEVKAVDFSAVALERAARLAEARNVRLRTQVADLTDYTPDPGAFDLVLVSYLHLPHPEMERVLRRAAEAARTGGTLLLVGHDLSNLTHGTGGPQDPGVLTTVELVTAAWADLADIEVAVVERRSVNQGREGDEPTPEALDTVVRAVRR